MTVNTVNLLSSPDDNLVPEVDKLETGTHDNGNRVTYVYMNNYVNSKDYGVQINQNDLWNEVPLT